MRLEKSAEAIVDHTGRRAESFSPRSSLSHLDERGAAARYNGSVIRPADFREAGSGSEMSEEQQAFTAMEQVTSLDQC